MDESYKPSEFRQRLQSDQYYDRSQRSNACFYNRRRDKIEALLGFHRWREGLDRAGDKPAEPKLPPSGLRWKSHLRRYRFRSASFGGWRRDVVSCLLYTSDAADDLLCVDL